MVTDTTAQSAAIQEVSEQPVNLWRLFWIKAGSLLASRKFLLTLAVLGVSSYGFERKLLDGSQWVGLCTVILGIHGIANIADKKLNGAAPTGDPVTDKTVG